MLNLIIITGRLTKDPELRMTQSQKDVASFTLAVDRDFQAQGEQRETDFIPCVAWGKTAEFVSKWFTKGSMAQVTGRLQLRKWTDRDGNKRETAEIVADRVYFGEKRQTKIEDAPRPAGAPVNVSAGGFEELPEDSGQLPF